MLILLPKVYQLTQQKSKYLEDTSILGGQHFGLSEALLCQFNLLWSNIQAENCRAIASDVRTCADQLLNKILVILVLGVKMNMELKNAGWSNVFFGHDCILVNTPNCSARKNQIFILDIFGFVKRP